MNWRPELTLANRFEIAGVAVGCSASPYVIAEAGSNFNQSMDTAKELIDVAAQAKADAVKFQLFRADVLYPGGGEMFDLFKSVELNAAWVPDLADYARSRKVAFMASAFDAESVKVLERVGVPAMKVASSETTNLPLLIEMARLGRPMLLSTGMCDMIDVETAVDICRGLGNTNVALMQCVAEYPLPVEGADLRVLDTFARRVGFSDHTLGLTAALAAVGLGATVFEKHFTLDKKAEGPDHFYALEPDDLTGYVAGIKEAYAALGSAEKKMSASERKHGRREGLYAARAISAGQRITAEDVAVKRPAQGIRGRYAQAIVGLTAARDVAQDAPIDWPDLRGDAS